MTRLFLLNVLAYLALNQPHPGFHGPSQPFLSCLPPLHAPQALLGDVHPDPKVDVLHSWAVVMRSSFSCLSMHQVIHNTPTDETGSSNVQTVPYELGIWILETEQGIEFSNVCGF